ncbi:MAG: [FeFe] hydrogenase H-cluster radical SAM maturase HydG [Kiritimatiellia bacterium]
MKKDLSKNAIDFIEDEAITALIGRPGPDDARLKELLAKSLDKQALTVEETAELIAADKPEQIQAIFETARELKRRVYGNRIVLFAPLYVGNRCINDCVYCSFRSTNKAQVRRTLETKELEEQVVALEQKGHKRLILVFGEHAKYSAEYIAECVKTVYAVKDGRGEIRRVNINAAPFDHEGFRTIKASGIGTYQVFQESYHHETYARMHPEGTRKSDFLWRLDSLSRAFEAGCDDMGVGALFGLYDWRFEVLGLVTHARHLMDKYKVGPHTISFPRLQPASGVKQDWPHLVNDDDFKRVIAILRLAVPYTGMILTARESPAFRREAMSFGVSQIDAGSRIELGGYTEAGDSQVMEREQFKLGDIRPLDTVMRELLQDGYIPSFCTSCYRLGRTGEHFMEFAIPGFIKRFCTPNALSTLTEYLVDYATPETRAVGLKVIEEELAKIAESPQKAELQERLKKIRETDARDLLY